MIRHWLLTHTPPGVRERPAEWFLAILSILSGVAGIFGPVDQASLDAILPHVLHYGWNVSLVIGGAALLVGLSSIKQIGPGYAVTRVPIYRLGCRLLGLASLVYATSLLIVHGLQAGYPAAVVLVFALVFAVRLLALKDRR